VRKRRIMAAYQKPAASRIKRGDGCRWVCLLISWGTLLKILRSPTLFDRVKLLGARLHAERHCSCRTPHQTVDELMGWQTAMPVGEHEAARWLSGSGSVSG